MSAMLTYRERATPIHQLTGAAKLICFILWSTLSMLTYDTRVLCFMLLISIVFFVISRITFKEVSFVLMITLIFLAINNIAIFIFSPIEGVGIYQSSHIIVELGGRYTVTWEQVFYQFNITLKYFTVIPAALLFILTTHPSEFASSLNRIGISYRISYAVALALRYIPDIQRDYQTISLAQQAKGIDLSKDARLFERLKNSLSIVLPMIFLSLERIDTVTNVMEMRGFGKNKKRTWYRQKLFTRIDYITVFAFLILFTVALTITFESGGRFYNPF